MCKWRGSRKNAGPWSDRRQICLHQRHYQCATKGDPEAIQIAPKRARAYDISRAAFCNRGGRTAAVCGAKAAVVLDAALAPCLDIEGKPCHLRCILVSAPGMCQTVLWHQWRVLGGFRRLRARLHRSRLPAIALQGARNHCDDHTMHTMFEAAGGNEGLRRLAAAWHRRVMTDEVVSHAFSHGFHPQHIERLAAYWAEALGGPSMYSDSYGNETTVVKMHSGNGKHEEMDRRAIACFDQAMIDAGLADDHALQQALHAYFAWATTTTMARYDQSADDVPDGLGIPHWSWDGLQELK